MGSLILLGAFAVPLVAVAFAAGVAVMYWRARRYPDGVHTLDAVYRRGVDDGYAMARERLEHLELERMWGRS